MNRSCTQLVETAKQVEVDAGDEAVFELGIGEAVPLSEQDGFEHGQQGKQSMCSAIMAYMVCRKKVLMENPLNVLGGDLGMQKS